MSTINAQLWQAVAGEHDLPLADPDRLFDRVATVITAQRRTRRAAAMQPAQAAQAAQLLLDLLIKDAPPRRAQAAAAADALMPALIHDCRRDGPSCAPVVFFTLVDDNPSAAAAAAAALRLGAVDALVRRVAALSPRDGNALNADNAAHSLRAVAQICAHTTETADGLRALVAAAPALLEQAARWLRRGSPVKARAAVVRLLSVMTDRRGHEGEAQAAEAVWSARGTIQGVADAVADAADFDAYFSTPTSPPQRRRSRFGPAPRARPRWPRARPATSTASRCSCRRAPRLRRR